MRFIDWVNHSGPPQNSGENDPQFVNLILTGELLK